MKKHFKETILRILFGGPIICEVFINSARDRDQSALSGRVVSFNDLSQVLVEYVNYYVIGYISFVLACLLLLLWRQTMRFDWWSLVLAIVSSVSLAVNCGWGWFSIIILTSTLFLYRQMRQSTQA
jgi:hypothetical protein